MLTPALAGILVMALEQAVAVPFATRQLADLGARVIKIERPAGGDFARGYDTMVRGLSSHFVWLNRGKQSLTADLKRPEAPLVLRVFSNGPTCLCRIWRLAPRSGWISALRHCGGGGNGFSKDFPVERYYRDAPLLVIGGGANELQRIIIARRLLQKYAI